MDWWSPRNNPAWGNSSVLNADFDKLEVFARSLSPFFWRIGGSQADTIIYRVRGDEKPCLPNHCLRMERWDVILDFAKRVGCRIIFCINYLSHTEVDGQRDRKDWDSSNAWDFLNYTANHATGQGLIFGFELGNELSHLKKATNITRMKVAYQELKSILNELWPENTPKVLGPASTGRSTIDLVKAFASELDVITYHKYHGKGDSPELEEMALKPSFYAHPVSFQERPNLMRESSNASIWIGEGAMAFNSGRPNVTDSFVSSLWTANLLGALAVTSHTVYCRQALMGGYYELIRHADFQPNPDFWMARLWKTIVGQVVVGPIVSPNRNDIYLDARITWGCCKEPLKDTLLAHSFCGKPSTWSQPGDLVLVIINISPKDSYSIKLPMGSGRSDFVMTGQTDTGEAGALGARTVLLNGEVQQMKIYGLLPPLVPQKRTQEQPLLVPPYSLSFAIIHNISLTPCLDIYGEKNDTLIDSEESEVSTSHSKDILINQAYDESPYDSNVFTWLLPWICLASAGLLLVARLRKK